jgi:lipopolysaccharide biosynthesis glycosyltransferase
MIYNIAVTPNSSYTNYLLVLLESLLVESNPDKRFRIFVIYNDLTESDIFKIRNFIERNNSLVEFIYLDGKKYQSFPSVGRFPIEAYFRLEVQDVIPADVHRLLYLDVDMLICGDIAELYHTDLGGKYLAACGFSTACEQGPEFNAGMLLMDLDRLRSEISFETYRKLADSLDGQFYADQGLLNAQFGENGTKYLPKKRYNFTCSFYRKFKDTLNQQGFQLDDIVIIHFAGPGIRPWQARWDADDRKLFGRNNLQDVAAASGYLLDEVYYKLQEKWWRAAEKTPGYEQLLNDMYRQKCAILTSILDKTMETREYRFGYRILKILRKFKRC